MKLSLTFRQKIVFSLVLMGMLPVVLFAGINFYNSYGVAMEQSEQKLTALRDGLKDRVSSQFMMIHAQTRVFGMNPSVLEAFKEFDAAYRAFDPANVRLDMAALKQRYAVQKEKTKDAGAGDVEAWMPQDAKALALQHLYIGANEHPVGSKHELDDPKDGSAYSQMHAKLHPFFRDFVDEFGFYDVFLVNTDGDVIYTNFKEIDFARNVKNGPLAQTNFGKLIKDILENRNDPEESIMTDFAPYLPSYNDAASFIASPLVEDGKTIGVVAFQMPVDKLSNMFSSVKEAGETADGYILSDDGRFITKPQRLDKNVGEKAVESWMKIVDKAYHEHVGGIKNFVEITGVEMIGAYEPLDIPVVGSHGLDVSTLKSEQKLPWVVTVVASYDEVMQVIYSQLMLGFTVLAVTALVTTLVGLWIAGTLVRPVQSLARGFFNGAEKVGQSTSQVGEAVSSMVAASEETSAQSTVIRKNSGEAAGYVSTVSTAVEELNISINDISQSIAETNVLIDDAVGKAKKTDDVVRKLGEASKKITEVVSLINDLAEQTNLLALNAAIEAARAGDAGRGFAVVADEVKKLASHTSQATVDIREQVQEIQDVSEQSVVALQAVVEAIHRIRDNATTVSAAVEEQSGVAKQIAGSVRDAATRVQQVDDNMNGIEQAANDTGVAADQVSKSVGEVQGSFNEMKTQMQSVLDEMGVKH